MRVRKQYPSQERLRELFDYDPEGFLVWKSGRRAGSYKLRADRLHYEYAIRIKIADRYEFFSGNRLIWIWHFGDIENIDCVFKKDWSKPPAVWNLYKCRFSDRNVRHNMVLPANRYKAVYRKKESDYWVSADLNGGEFTFLTEQAAATHYDNVCEDKHGIGDRPNSTKRKDVSHLRITKTIAMYMASSKKSIRDRGIVGVYKTGEKFSSRFAKNNLGTFKTQEEAARAYNIAAYDHYGELAVLNDIPDPLGNGDIF